MNDRTPSPSSDRDWQPFARLDFLCTTDSWERLEALLLAALSPLSLPVELSSKLLESARTSAACIPFDTHQVRLAVFTSAARPAPGQSWGFFRMLKEERLAEVSTRVITFYLYIEGRATPA